MSSRSKRCCCCWLDGAHEALVMLGPACMAYNTAERPTFQHIFDILEQLNDVITGRNSSTGKSARGGCAADVESF
jgi:hypothetical protein